MLPGLCKLGCASNSANPFSAASPVLGGVTMGETPAAACAAAMGGGFYHKMSARLFSACFAATLAIEWEQKGPHGAAGGDL